MNNNMNLTLPAGIRLAYEDPGTMCINKTLSPFNENEDNTSKPKISVNIGFSTYSDIAYMSILDNDGEVVRDFMLKVNENNIELIHIEDGIDDERILWQEDMKTILRDIGV